MTGYVVAHSINKVMGIQLEKEELKNVIKESLVEVLDQKKEFFQRLFEEVVEDQLFITTLKEAEESGVASRVEIFDALRS